MSRFDEVAEQLASLNLQIKHDMERAEAKVEQVGHLIRELGHTGLLRREILLGGHFERLYDPDHGPHDSGQVVQAALLIPEGFGVCLWDTEEFSQLQSSPEGLESRGRISFHPFDNCSPAEKKFLLPFVEEMLEELTDIALVAASKLEPDPSLPTAEYFQQRTRNVQRNPGE